MSANSVTILKSASWGNGDGTVLPTVIATVSYSSTPSDKQSDVGQTTADGVVAYKSVVREQVWRRDAVDEAAIQSRKKWARFGSAKGHKGPERGVTMTSPDKFTIEDPYGVDGQQTGEDMMIERLKQSVKHRNSNARSPARSRTPVR